MTQKNRPEAEKTQVRRSRTGRRGRKRHVKYSPLSLVFLAICSFVFSFSLVGMFEQVVLDVAGQAEIKDFGAGVFDPLPGDGNDNSIVPSFDGKNSMLQEWQQISPEEIDTENFPYLQTVGFKSLQEQNEDTVAWMYWPTTTDVKGLPFNLPVVQSVDNEFYLSHSFDKSSSNNGWIYVDYRCDTTNITSNRNTILYAHARSYLMFGGLRYLNTKTKWQQDGYNHFIYLNTPTERTVWQVFAWYETTTAFNYIDTDFSGDSEYVEFLNTLQSQNTISAFESFNFTPENRILTLSTCKGSNSDVRIAVHAVLVKHERIRGSEVSTEDVTEEVETITADVSDATDVTDITDTTDIIDVTDITNSDGSVSDAPEDSVTDVGGEIDETTDPPEVSSSDVVNDATDVSGSDDAVSDAPEDTVADVGGESDGVTDSSEASSDITDDVTDVFGSEDSVSDAPEDSVTDFGGGRVPSTDSPAL